MSKDNEISAASGLNNNYAIRTYNLQANVPQALPSGRKFILVSATVDITALSLSLGAENANFDNLILGISVGIREGSIKARLISTTAQTVVMAIVTGHADIVDSRFAPSGATLPVSEADGANIALGARADASATTDAGTFSLIALMKRLLGKTGVTIPAPAIVGTLGAIASGTTNSLGTAMPSGDLAIGFIVDANTFQNASMRAVVHLQLSFDGGTNYGNVLSSDQLNNDGATMPTRIIPPSYLTGATHYRFQVTSTGTFTIQVQVTFGGTKLRYVTLSPIASSPIWDGSGATNNALGNLDIVASLGPASRVSLSVYEVTAATPGAINLTAPVRGQNAFQAVATVTPAAATLTGIVLDSTSTPKFNPAYMNFQVGNAAGVWNMRTCLFLMEFNS